MNDPVILRIDGQVDRPVQWTFADLEALGDDCRVLDVNRLDATRQGDAILLSAIASAVGVRAEATHLGLHGSADDFHASIPFAPVRDRGLLIYRLDGQPLATSQGGPARFLIRDHAACHTHEIDECANVKFVDHIEFTVGRGFDNRPQDDDEHEQLHQRQAEGENLKNGEE